MRRSAVLLLTTATLGLTAAGTVAKPAAHPSKGAKVRVAQTGLGKILVNGRGFTLYVFARDTKKHDMCVAIRECTGIWPVFTTSAKPRAGAGLKRFLLGTIKVAGGERQVTYAGHPLYMYSGDSGPGQTDYVGTVEFGGAWDAINAQGKVIQ